MDMSTSRITHLEAVIKDLETQVENYKNDAYVLSLLTKLDGSEKHNQELRGVNARHVRMLATIIPLPDKWRGKPYRSEMSIRLANELQAKLDT